MQKQALTNQPSLVIAPQSLVHRQATYEAIRIDACSTAAGPACPDCGSKSTPVHSSCLRFPADVPGGGRLVVLRLRVRRFFCPESSCARRTFAEQLPGLTRRHSRWTERLRSTLAAVGLALAGRAGARLARTFGMSISRSAVLRLLDALPEPESRPRGWSVLMSTPHATPHAKDGSTARCSSTARPVSRWMCCLTRPAWPHGRRTDPGSRSSAGTARRSSRRGPAGAPQATQVADRWHSMP
ncbi:transposase family protein [Streptomyces griseoloalbus]|uniref:Transposase family protein n=1 Tax=Streptomyces griseoloalbus TaxID=67303 RepID=A0ABV3E8X9_9ACTN